MTLTILAVKFGEMELSSFTFYGLIATAACFIVSFALASIPLAQNMMTRKEKEK